MVIHMTSTIGEDHRTFVAARYLINYLTPSVLFMGGVTHCRVWDLASGQLKATLEGHTDPLTSVAISPDGATLVSASDDQTIR
jgi:WD40 repeat protein